MTREEIIRLLEKADVTVYERPQTRTAQAIEEAIELIEQELNTDMVAVLTEIQLEIEDREESIIGHYGKETKESDFPSHKIERNNGRKECIDLIQQKIDKLKEVEQ